MKPLYVGWTKRALAHSSARIHIALTCTLLATSACSTSSQNGQSVRIVLPEESVSHSSSTSALTINSLYSGLSLKPADPSALADFECFAVNVSGSGIPNDGRAACSDPNDSVAALVGLVPSSAGHIDVFIPSGPSRRVQLIGVRSSNGTCPNMNQLLDNLVWRRMFRAANPGATLPPSPFDELGDFYRLGETSVDVFNDTEVKIVASFNSTTSKKLFENCGEGEGSLTKIPLSVIQTGYIAGSHSSSSIDTTFSLAPQSLSSITDYDSTHANYSLITTMEDWLALPLSSGSAGVYQYSIAGASLSSKRASIQLKWKVNSYDPTSYPMFKIESQIGGDTDGTCSFVSSAGAQLGVYDGTNWDVTAHPIESIGSNIQSSPFYRNTASYVYTDGNGDKWITARVQSNIASTGTGASLSCLSRVAVGGAALYLFKQVPALSIKIGSPEVGTVNTSQPGISVYSTGGVPPYTISAARISGSGGTGTITTPTTPDNLRGSYTYLAPSTVGTIRFTVTDSAGTVLTKDLTVQVP